MREGMQRGRSTMQADDVVDDNNDQQTYVCREAAKQLRPLKLTSFLSARIRSPPIRSRSASMSMCHKSLTHQLGMAGLAERGTRNRLRLFNEIFLGGEFDFLAFFDTGSKIVCGRH